MLKCNITVRNGTQIHNKRSWNQSLTLNVLADSSVGRFCLKLQKFLIIVYNTEIENLLHRSYRTSAALTFAKS